MRWETVATVLLLAATATVLVSAVVGLVADCRSLRHEPRRGRSRC